MQLSINEVTLGGNLAFDPTIRATQSGTKVARLRLITNESYKDENGQWHSRPTGHNIVVFGPRAGMLEQRAHAGMSLYVRGKLVERSYDKDGVTHKVTEIHVTGSEHKCQVLTNRKDTDPDLVDDDDRDLIGSAAHSAPPVHHEQDLASGFS